MVYFAQDYVTLILAYIFVGITGGCGPIGIFFLAECVSPKIRGIILDVKYSWKLLGIIAPRFITPYCSWRLLSLYSAGTIIFCVAISLYGPESPAWYASKGRFEECKTAFVWLRGEKDVAELNELIECQQNAITEQRTAIYATQSWGAKIFKFMFDKSFLKAAFIAMLCVLFYDFTGKFIILTYVDILNEITNDPDNYDFYFQLLGLSDIFSLAVSVIAVYKLHRRTLLFGAGIPAVLFLFLFCMLTFFNTIRAPWLRFALICLFFFFVTSGPLTILNAIQGEIFPLRHRGAGAIFTSFLFVSISFAVSKCAPRLLMYLTIQGILFINAVVLTVCLLILYFYMPETFNRTLQNIENELKDKLPNQMSDTKLQNANNFD